jgi:hypothetical protein
VELKIGFGFANVLAAVAVEPHATRMHARALAYQQAVQAFVEPGEQIRQSTASEGTAA